MRDNKPIPSVKYPERPQTSTDQAKTTHSTALLVVASIAQLMVVLDIFVVNVALPAIRHDLNFSQSGLQWVLNAYTITFAGFLLFGGRMSDILGRRRVFLSALGLFSVTSLIGGLAPNQGSLLAARALQGVAAAVLSPGSLTLLTTTFTESRARARAVGIWTAMGGLGGAGGVLVGGLITDLTSWRWVLLINVPIGAALLVASWMVVTERRQSGVGWRDLDAPGAVLATLGIGGIVLGVIEGASSGWGSIQSIGGLATGVVLLVGFLVQERFIARKPLLPLGILANRAVAAPNLVMILIGAAVFPSFYFLSLYFQEVLNYSPLRAGVAFLPETIGIVIGARAAGSLVGKVQPRTLAMAGGGLAAVGLGWLAFLGPDSGYVSSILLPSLLVTVGGGGAFTGLAVIATAAAPGNNSGLASGLINDSRQLGAAIGLASLATVALSESKHSLVHLASTASALASGYTSAFAVGSVIAVAAIVVGLAVPRLESRSKTTTVNNRH